LATFSLFDDVFIPSFDPYGRNGPNLDQLLNKLVLEEDGNQMSIKENSTSSRTRLPMPTSRSNVNLDVNALTSNNEYENDVGSVLFERQNKIIEDSEATVNSSVRNSELNFKSSKNAPNSPTLVEKTPPRTDRSLQSSSSNGHEGSNSNGNFITKSSKMAKEEKDQLNSNELSLILARRRKMTEDSEAATNRPISNSELNITSSQIETNASTLVNKIQPPS